MHREETKGFGSNAGAWRRLKNRGELSVYIAIAKTIGLKMSYIDRPAYEYRPDMSFPAVMFVWPRDSPENILIARNAIAEFAVEKNINLNTAIPERYLNPERPRGPVVDWWDRIDSMDRGGNQFYNSDLSYDHLRYDSARFKKSHMGTHYVKSRLDKSIMNDYFPHGG